MRARGFTLLEVVLAITVLGVVMAMLTLSLSATLRVVESTEKQEEIFFVAQTAMRRITEDLAAAVPTGDVSFTGEKKGLRDRRADQLRFASQARLIFNPDKQKPGRALIRYQALEDPADRRMLRLTRQDTLILPGVDTVKVLTNQEAADPAFLLADGLRAVRFAYFDREGQEFDGWGEEEQAKEEGKAGALPAAVHCTLEFWIDPDKDMVQTFSTRVLVPAESADGQ